MLAQQAAAFPLVQGGELSWHIVQVIALSTFFLSKIKQLKQIFDHTGEKNHFDVVVVVVSFVFLLGRPLLLPIKSTSLFLLLLCVSLKICVFVICIVRVQYKRPVLHAKQDTRHSSDADQWGGFGAMLWLHQHRHHPHTATRWLRQHARGGQETWQLIWVWGSYRWGDVGWCVVCDTVLCDNIWVNWLWVTCLCCTRWGVMWMTDLGWQCVSDRLWVAGCVLYKVGCHVGDRFRVTMYEWWVMGDRSVFCTKWGVMWVTCCVWQSLKFTLMGWHGWQVVWWQCLGDRLCASVMYVVSTQRLTQCLGDRLCASVMYVVSTQRLTLFIVKALFMTVKTEINTVHHQSTVYDCKDRLTQFIVKALFMPVKSETNTVYCQSTVYDCKVRD